MPQLTTQYRITLKRDADFWQDELAITDSDGAAVTLSDAELIIHPSSGGPNVLWNVGNGHLSLPSPGVILFNVSLEVIAAYTWSSGTYCLAITYTNGKRDLSFLTGRVEIKDVC